jgi:hypothetical protein
MLRGNSRPDMRVRDLRHSCATLLLAQSVSPRVILETSRALSDLAHSEHVRPRSAANAGAQWPQEWTQSSLNVIRGLSNGFGCS